MTGFNECKGKVIVTMDDDLQHSPNSIIDILNELNKGFDVCYTKYLNRKHPTWKKGVSWLNAIISSFLYVWFNTDFIDSLTMVANSGHSIAS